MSAEGSGGAPAPQTFAPKEEEKPTGPEEVAAEKADPASSNNPALSALAESDANNSTELIPFFGVQRPGEYKKPSSNSRFAAWQGAGNRFPAEGTGPHVYWHTSLERRGGGKPSGTFFLSPDQPVVLKGQRVDVELRYAGMLVERGRPPMMLLKEGENPHLALVELDEFVSLAVPSQGLDGSWAADAASKLLEEHAAKKLEGAQCSFVFFVRFVSRYARGLFGQGAQ